jgi:hypothetical protein
METGYFYVFQTEMLEVRDKVRSFSSVQESVKRELECV